jgi:hypothetical protein
MIAVLMLNGPLRADTAAPDAAPASAAPSAPASAPPAAPLPQIPDSIKQSAIGNAEQQSIDAAVAQAAANLANGADPAGQSAARLWFAQGAVDSNGNPGSADFQQYYAQSVNNHLLAVVSAPGANFRAKVEAGLASQYVAQRTSSTATTPLAIKLLQDPLPGVKLIGMKAAAGLIAVMFNQSALDAQDQKLLDQVVDTAIHNPDPPLGGPITEEAYNALETPVFHAVGSNANQLLVKYLAPTVLKLQEQRIQLYKAGTPESPQADSTGVVILLSRDIWGGLDKGQQQQVLQNVAELIGLTSDWAQKAKADNDQAATLALLAALQTDGRELRLFSDPARGVLEDQALSNSVAHLASLGSGSGTEAIETASSETVAGLKDLIGRLP